MDDKNLLVISPHYVTFVKDQVEELAKYLGGICVISPEPYGRDNLKNLANLPENVEVYFPKFFHLPTGYFRKRLGDNFFKAAMRVIQREKLEFDLIHAHFTWPSGYAGVMIGKKFGVPIIVTAHGDDVRIPLTNYLQSFDNSFLRLKLDEVVNGTNVILTHHEELRDLLLSSYPQQRHKIKFVYKGINLERFSPLSRELKRRAAEMRKSLGIENRFVVLFLARVDWDKDPLTFVEAAKLLRKNEEIAFVMVGGGALLKRCIREKTKYRLENLHIIGPRSDTEVWYALSDVFVALSPVENIWSTTLQEALVMGLPSIVTSVGYTPRILKDQIDVLMIPSKDPKALMRAIIRLLEDEDLRERLSQNALKWRNQFDNSRIVKEILKIYAGMVG